MGQDTEIIFIMADLDAIDYEDKVSGDNIYKALVFFDRMYDKMNETEKREFLEQLISKVEKKRCHFLYL